MPAQKAKCEADWRFEARRASTRDMLHERLQYGKRKIIRAEGFDRANFQALGDLYLDFVFSRSAAPECAADPRRNNAGEMPVLRRAKSAGLTQRGRVVRPACFQSFSHCQMPGVL